MPHTRLNQAFSTPSSPMITPCLPLTHPSCNPHPTHHVPLHPPDPTPHVCLTHPSVQPYPTPHLPSSTFHPLSVMASCKELAKVTSSSSAARKIVACRGSSSSSYFLYVVTSMLVMMLQFCIRSCMPSEVNKSGT